MCVHLGLEDALGSPGKDMEDFLVLASGTLGRDREGLAVGTEVEPGPAGSHRGGGGGHTCWGAGGRMHGVRGLREEPGP